ncbi:flavonoid 3'-monooxygenase CYP75B137-like isoform X2 [Juglans microcarpa x Juglans regia]|uniref:flavonoid 3'-monooxygenase CYP75B137-like isoform X2 n=1 Tax=Juglans microcarpa x Juglans regia TaxID=2249226 RepID=UPI001B7D9315|nr:flavonoid 3'-monooxygenase CYP75B137-like isoform X2 [Juglans microcarpa x Juglans regia]
MGSWRSYAGDERFSSSTLTVLIGIFAMLWLLWAIKKQRKAAVPPLPPGPRGLPIVGYLPFIGTELHIKFEQLCGIYGPIYKVWFANKLCIVISSPSLVKEVVRDQDALFSNRDVNKAILAITYGGADIAFSPNGPNWKMLRKMFVREMLSASNLDTTFTLRREEMKSLAKAKEEGKTKTGRKDFLQVLLEIREQNNGAYSISMTQLKAVLVDIVVGASDTTTTMLEWVMARLMKHSEIMRKVHEELTEIVGVDNLVEEFHLPKLQYLDAVIKETFRLHPPFPFLVPRTPSESSIIGGYHVPKGSSIFVNVWAIQRNSKYWDNPLEFIPERFLNDGYGRVDYSGNNFKYFPFGSGRRICAGLTLGERTLKYILASFLHSFEWKLPQGSEIDVSDTYGVVTKKKNPTIAIPTPRLSKSELYTE